MRYEQLLAEAREWVQEENWESDYEQDGFNRPGTELIGRLADALESRHTATREQLGEIIWRTSRLGKSAREG